ncbi:hypothetical protein [Streptomyces sp. NPDC096153]|uniref:hypothetical protein n=1 Tax=Streptomyces sp. NPDC096153 TaxID=3155548 RepID=UPI00332106C9
MTAIAVNTMLVLAFAAPLALAILFVLALRQILRGAPRPPAGTAEQDAAALALAEIRAQCEDWANPALGGGHDARVRDQSVANAAGILLGIIEYHERSARP